MPSLAFDIRIRIRHVAQDVAPTLDVDQTSLLRATDAFHPNRRPDTFQEFKESIMPGSPNPTPTV